MKEYIRLISKGNIKFKQMITNTFQIENANEAYKLIQSQDKPLVVLFSYPKSDNKQINKSEKIRVNIENNKNDDKIQIGIIGAGSFVKSSHLQNIKFLIINVSLGQLSVEQVLMLL